MCLVMNFFEFIYLRLAQLLESVVISFHHIWEILSHYLFEYSSYLFILLPGPWGYERWIFRFVSEVPEALFICFQAGLFVHNG